MLMLIFMCDYSEYNSSGWFPGSLETGYFFGITLLNHRMHLT